MKVRVIGSGTMGIGIAQIAATYQHEVCVYDSFEGLPDNNINDSVDSDTAKYSARKGSMACSIDKVDNTVRLVRV